MSFSGGQPRPRGTPKHSATVLDLISNDITTAVSDEMHLPRGQLALLLSRQPVDGSSADVEELIERRSYDKVTEMERQLLEMLQQQVDLLEQGVMPAEFKPDPDRRNQVVDEIVQETLKELRREEGR